MPTEVVATRNQNVNPSEMEFPDDGSWNPEPYKRTPVAGYPTELRGARASDWATDWMSEVVHKPGEGLKSQRLAKFPTRLPGSLDSDWESEWTSGEGSCCGSCAAGGECEGGGSTGCGCGGECGGERCSGGCCGASSPAGGPVMTPGLAAAKLSAWAASTVLDPTPPMTSFVPSSATPVWMKPDWWELFHADGPCQYLCKQHWKAVEDCFKLNANAGSRSEVAAACASVLLLYRNCITRARKKGAACRGIPTPGKVVPAGWDPTNFPPPPGVEGFLPCPKNAKAAQAAGWPQDFAFITKIFHCSLDCFRQPVKDKSNPIGNQCCYDTKTGQIVTDQNCMGTLDLASPMISKVRHQRADVVTWIGMKDIEFAIQCCMRKFGVPAGVSRGRPMNKVIVEIIARDCRAKVFLSGLGQREWCK